MKVMKRRFLISFSLLVVILAASWPLLRPGMFEVHDFIHGVRITEMTAGLQEGQFPVRWSQNFGYGYGMPLFEFYAPLPYFIGSLFYQAGISLLSSVKLLFLVTTVLTAIGGYFFGRELFQHKATGVLVAAALTLAPYRALNLFVRGAVSESWGMMAIPWILLGLLVVRRDLRKGAKLLIGGLVVLLLSHNLTALISAPFFVLFYLFLVFDGWYLQKRPLHDMLKELGVVVLSVGLSIGLSAFYIFPALFEKNFTQVEATILSGYFDFSLHFLYIRQFFKAFWGYGGSEWGPNDPISFYLGTGQLLALAGSALLVGKALFAEKSRSIRNNAVLGKNLITVAVLFVLLGLGLYLSLERSFWIWRAVPFLSYIQFPWRYISMASVFLATFAGVPLLFLKGRKARFYIVSMFLILLGNTFFFRPERYLAVPAEQYYDNPALVASEMSKTLPDYIPMGVDLVEISPPTEALTCSNTSCQYEVVDARAHEKVYILSGTPQQEELMVTFAVADFPGWQVIADGKVLSHWQSPAGFIETSLPAGTKEVALQLLPTKVRSISDTLSALSLMAVLAMYLFQNKGILSKKERS